MRTVKTEILRHSGYRNVQKQAITHKKRNILLHCSAFICKNADVNSYFPVVSVSLQWQSRTFTAHGNILNLSGVHTPRELFIFTSWGR